MTDRRIARRRVLSALALIASAAAGCGASAPAEKGNLTVGFIYIGSKHDYGYNQAHAQGAAAVKNMPGVRVTEEEMVPDTVDCQKSMKSMIKLDGAGVIFPTSFGYFEPHMLTLAAQFPKVKFIHCGGLYDPKHPANVSTYFGFIDECEYLSGIVAAHATRSKKLGFVAGKPIPQVKRNVNAFTMGARSVDPSITCTVTFTGDWSLPNREAESANTLIDQGVDVLTCHVNSPKIVIETAERRGIFTYGYHANQRELAPKGYLTGAEWAWEKIYCDYVARIKAGSWKPGLVRGGLKEGFVRMSAYGPGVSEQGRAAAEAAKAKFLAGDFVLFQGPLRDNTGKTVIAAGRSMPQIDPELEKMDYLVEGVIGQ
jgi:simple sugar transport system substrate-binding protein